MNKFANGSDDPSFKSKSKTKTFNNNNNNKSVFKSTAIDEIHSQVEVTDAFLLEFFKVINTMYFN